MAHSACDSMSVLANLVPGMCRGGSCSCLGAASRVAALGFLSDLHPYTGSRLWQTGDRKLHNGMRGDVSSAWVPTVLGMARQCLNLQRSDRHDRTGPGVAEVMEKTRSTGLTSRRHPGRALSWWSYTFRGCCRPLSRGATWRRYGNGWHSVTDQ
jgi:hypothetical protein